jgi:predicted RNA-binding protein with PUA-like domain
MADSSQSRKSEVPASPQLWLLKTEPHTYSFEQLTQEKKTNWNHVRNFQARNFLRQARKGDLAVIYHSGDEKAVVGLSRVIREAYPDYDPEYDGEERGDWVQIDLEFVAPFLRPIPLAEIKTTEGLATLPLIKQSRLSVMPITQEHYETLLNLSQKTAMSSTPLDRSKRKS